MDTPSHDSPYDALLATAVEAARAGAAVIRRQAGRLDRVRQKGVNDFVTATDEAAQAAIVDVLRQNGSSSSGPAGSGSAIDILAEEGNDGASVSASIDGRRWIVDPLDGTTNFMQQVPPYAVSIALQEGDALVAGVVLDVTQDELFTAVQGHGLQVNGAPASVSDRERLDDAFVATGFPYRRFEHTDEYLDVLRRMLPATRGVRRHGAASVDLARLACGRFDAFFETGLRPWDMAAGIVLIREGGGTATDYRGEAGLAPAFGRQLCASNGAVHDPLLEMLASMKDVRL